MATRKAQQIDTLGLEMGNKPPQAIDVEEAVLGAMMLEPMCVDQAMEDLTPACFYDPKHRLIFEAMCALVNAHTSVDIVTVSNMLKSQGNLETVGGTIFLATLSEKVGSVAHIEYYNKILKQKTIQRDLISASYDILKESYDDSVNVDELIDKAQSRVFEAIQTNIRNEIQDIGSAINEVTKRMQEMQNCGGMSGVPSGFKSIDDMTMGWQPSDLIIIAARPSVGKTAFSLNLARNAAVKHHMPVAFFSLEMSTLQLATRLVITETKLPPEKIKGGVKLSKYEWEELESKIKDLSSAPLYIDDTPSLPIMEFRTKAKNLVKNKGVRLIMVDYLQLMQGPQNLKGIREQEVAAISRALKATAKELNVPIIALSQLRRMSEARQGSEGKPQLSDLRESGSIEQDADLVIFIHRKDLMGIGETEADRDSANIIIAKHRNGQTGEIPMLFKGSQVEFVEPQDSLNFHSPYGNQIPVESRMNNESSWA